MRNFIHRRSEQLAVLAIYVLGIVTFIVASEPYWALPFTAYAGYTLGDIVATERAYHLVKRLLEAAS